MRQPHSTLITTNKEVTSTVLKTGFTMQTLFALLLVSLAAVCWAQDQPIFTPKTWLKTVKELERSKYIGRWYQVSSYICMIFTRHCL